MIDLGSIADLPTRIAIGAPAGADALGVGGLDRVDVVVIAASVTRPEVGVFAASSAAP